MAPMPALDTWRSAPSGTGAGLGSADEGDWFIRPEDVVICKDPRGNDWQLGSGAYGSVRPHTWWRGSMVMAVMNGDCGVSSSVWFVELLEVIICVTPAAAARLVRS